MSARRIGFELNPHLIGGTENFLRRLFTVLDRRRYAPVVIASDSGRWQELLSGVAETHVVPYLAAVDRPADVAGPLGRLRLDLVQSSYFSPVIALAALQVRIPHVWRLGGHVRLIDRSERERRRFLAIVQLTARRVICASRFLRSQFADAGAPPIDVIYNGIDVDEVPVAPAIKSQPGGARIAMLAHLVPSKRHDVFLRAAALVAAQRPRCRFEIFGDCFPTPDMLAYARSVRDLVRELALDGVLTIRPLGGERFDVLREVDIFAMPVEHEGASNAILEAMALGKPVVAARSGGNPELVQDGATGWIVDPGDPHRLAAALLDLIDDPIRRQAFGAAARRRAEAAFDIRACARRYEDLYSEVLDAGAQPASVRPCAE